MTDSPLPRGGSRPSMCTCDAGTVPHGHYIQVDTYDQRVHRFHRTGPAGPSLMINDPLPAFLDIPQRDTEPEP